METPAEVQVACPYCGAHFETLVEAQASGYSYIEDCRVCCRPVELRVRVGADGTLQEVAAEPSE